MDIICEHCQSKFKIPDEKIPVGKVVSVPCPKCKNKITVSAAQKPEPTAPATETGAGAMGDLHEDTYDAAEKPFDFVEEEGKTVLICESDPAVKKTLVFTLENMEYHITDAKDTRDAVTKMRYHVYDLILVNESFDTANPDQNGVLGYLERLSMPVRRDIFVTMISNRFRTMDNMMAFNKSVNMVLNVKNINDIEKILTGGITENDFFYRIYKDTLKKLGKV
jgi:predicted Zn finger-like uncharacterized protein